VKTDKKTLLTPQTVVFKEVSRMASRTSRGGILTLGLMVSVLVLLSYSRPTQAQDTDQRGSIRATLLSTRGYFDVTSAHAVGATLVSRQYALVVLQPKGVSSETLVRVGHDLGDRQLEWQNHEVPGTTEADLISRMNTVLETDKFPEYLRFRPRDVRRARVLLRLTMPELRELDKHQAEALPAHRLAPAAMSPLETFMLADYLLYLKSFDDDFLRTTAEDHAAVRKGTEVTRRPAGLSLLPENDRRGQLESHLTTLAETKQLGVEEAGSMLYAVLYGRKK
jgi:hypothetical protein